MLLLRHALLMIFLTHVLNRPTSLGEFWLATPRLESVEDMILSLTSKRSQKNDEKI
jgi:hypothetical protein